MSTKRIRTLLVLGLGLALVGAIVSTPARGTSPSQHKCISNCVARRGTLDQIAAAMKGWHYGPKKITRYHEGMVRYFEVQRRNGHKILRVHAKAAYYPPATPSAGYSAQRRDDCWWNMFDSSCFSWNWPRVWDDVAGSTNSLGETALHCLEGSSHGFMGNLTKAEAGTMWFYTIGSDLTDTPFIRATPGGLALATLGDCIWGIYQNR